MSHFLRFFVNRKSFDMANYRNNLVTVGILIPTYDRPYFLKQSLASAIGQSYRELEIIVIDNGKTELSQEIIANINDPRVRYIHNEKNIYLIGSIRKGMKLFSDSVSWCTILPDDDLLDHDFVTSMTDYLKVHSDATVVHGHRILIDAVGERTGETSLPPECETAVEYLINRSLFIRQTFLVGVFFCRAAYERLGGYPEFTTGMATDDALIFGLSLSHGLCFNKQAITSVRMYPEAESHSSSNVIGHIRAFEDFRSYILKVAAVDNISKSDLMVIRRSLNSYTRMSIGAQWLRRVHELLLSNLLSHDQELPSLYSLVRRNCHLFPWRIRVDVFFARVLPWNLESNKWYRYFWNMLDMLLIQWNRKTWRRFFTGCSKIKKCDNGPPRFS